MADGDNGVNSDEYLKDIGPCVCVCGSVASGFKVYGPFDDGFLALKWAEENSPMLTQIVVMELKSPEGPL